MGVKNVVESKLGVRFPKSSGIMRWHLKKWIKSIEYDV